MLYASRKSTFSLKTGTDSDGSKIGQSPTETKHLCDHSVGKKHYFGHVKFEEVFVISFKRKIVINKK
jgi:hypothetical protein